MSLLVSEYSNWYAIVVCYMNKNVFYNKIINQWIS